MPDNADDEIPTYPGALISRRSLVGLGVASALLARAGQLGATAGLTTAGLTTAGLTTAGLTTAGLTSPAQLANRGTVVEFSEGVGGATVLSSLRNASTHFEWTAAANALAANALAPTIRASGEAITTWRPLPFKSSPSDICIRAVSSGKIEAQLNVAAYPDSGAFHWQQSFRNIGTNPLRNIIGMSALDLELRGDLGRLVVHCVRRDGDYTREAQPFRSHLEVQGGRWNAPVFTGLIVIEAVGKAEFLVIGVQQERGWTLSLDQLDDHVRISVSLHDMDKNIAPKASLAACPIFIGACGGDLDTAINMALDHLRTRLLPPVLNGAPWFSYNIWSTDAAEVEKNILDEIAFAATIGVDLFYLDASWYKNSSTRGTGDWGKGLGSYIEDRSKFPRGLRYLSDQVHAAGMKFGLWVGPNIVDASLVPHEVPHSWLAMVDGKPIELKIPTWENTCLQVCIGSTDYAEHLKHSLAKLVEDYKLDWIKWDNSGIPALPARCNRSDHGHNQDDGSASALDREYAIFEFLHQKFPALALEQCGYGSRLDYGLARTIRANWCSDTCYPASRLRSNSLVCATVYPSAYNAAWIVKEDTELFEAKSVAVIDAGIRSRMIGLFGVGTLNGQMSQRASLYPKPIIDRLAKNASLYKRYRHLLFQQVSFPYKPYGTDPHGWQAIQFTSTAGSEAVVLCFRGSSTQITSLLPLSRLHPLKSYRVQLIDGGTESTLGGKELMETGIFLSVPEPGASEIILINEV